MLVESFLEVCCRELGKPLCKVSPEAMELLAAYPWPGNVRELQSVLKRAVLQTSFPLLLPADLPASLRSKEFPAVDLESYVEGRLRAGSTALHAEALDYMERIVLTRGAQAHRRQPVAGGADSQHHAAARCGAGFASWALRSSRP